VNSKSFFFFFSYPDQQFFYTRPDYVPTDQILHQNASTSILAGLMLPITLRSPSVIIIKEQGRTTGGHGNYGGDGKRGDGESGGCLSICFHEKPNFPNHLVFLSISQRALWIA
jgi:hypothetical protein